MNYSTIIKLRVSFLLILFSFGRPLMAAQDEMKCTVSVKVNTYCFLKISYVFPDDEKFIYEQSKGIHLNKGTQFETFEVTIPSGISGIRLSFYGGEAKMVQIKSIRFEHEAKQILFGPEELFSDLYWGNLGREGISIKDENVTISARQTKAGLGATVGTLRFTSHRKFNKTFNGTVYEESHMNIKLRSKENSLLKLYYLDEKSSDFFYEYSAKIVNHDKNFNEYKFDIITNQNIAKFKIGFGDIKENLIEINEINYISNTFTRSWKGRQFKRNFKFNTLVENINFDENRNLQITTYDENPLANAEMVLKMTELISRKEEVQIFAFWTSTFIIFAVLLLLFNKFFFISGNGSKPSYYIE